MKTTLTIMILLILSVVAFTIPQSLAVDPLISASAEFSWFPEDPGTGSLIQFIDESSNPENIDTWSWNFAGLGYSNDPNPTFLFIWPGLYTVELTVEYDGGTIVTVSHDVTVIENQPPARVVDIDIKPGSDPNSINLNSKGVVSIAVLTTDVFDASTIDPVTVLFARAQPLRWAIEDVDADSDLDMILKFKIQELDLTVESTEATLTGTIQGGGPAIEGTDAVNIVPQEKL